MTDYTIVQTAFFAKQVKKLLKRYRNIENDIDDFIDGLKEAAQLGTSLGKNLYKVRIKNSSARRGKSGGFRLITQINSEKKQIALVYIYSKSDLENISEQELDEIIKRTGDSFV